HPDALLLVGGAGPDRSAVEAAAATLPPGSTFLLGQVDDPTRADLYAGADLFVMPNRPRAGDAEGFGLAGAQAASAGLPVVATARDGARPWLSSGPRSSCRPCTTARCRTRSARSRPRSLGAPTSS